MFIYELWKLIDKNKLEELVLATVFSILVLPLEIILTPIYIIAFSVEKILKK